MTVYNDLQYKSSTYRKIEIPEKNSGHHLKVLDIKNDRKTPQYIPQIINTNIKMRNISKNVNKQFIRLLIIYL